MTSLSVKEYLSLKMPTEEAPVSDQSRILLALDALGYEHVTIPLHILRILYPMCRDANFDITVTLVHREHDWVVTHVEPGDQRHHHYGLAVDYGSTTILMQLIDLNTGSIIAEEKVVNGQVAYGTDILTRITYCLEHEKHPANLQRTTVETFHSLLAQLTESTGIEAAKCSVMVVSGNTTMVHFLLGLNAWTVFAAPFAPVTADPGFLWGHELGMDFEGLLYFIPAASNYVGGDIVSGLLELGIHKREETNLFFDIGTNGELVIGNDQWLVAGAGAAGPALEGYISRFGMQAMMISSLCPMNISLSVTKCRASSICLWRMFLQCATQSLHFLRGAGVRRCVIVSRLWDLRRNFCLTMQRLKGCAPSRAECLLLIYLQHCAMQG